MRIDQFLAGFARYDAISSEARAIQKVIRSMGHSSDIFAWPEFLAPDLRDQALPIHEYRKSFNGAAVIYHFSTGSPIAEFIRRVPGPKIMRYHNVTPSHFLDGYSEVMREELSVGRRQLHALRECFDLSLAVSEYNRLDLDAAGYPRSSSLPILLDPAEYTSNREVAPHEDARTTILNVSRFAPNKCQHDIIRAFWIYQKYFNAKSRLILAGGHSVPSYAHQVGSLVDELGVKGVLMPGPVTSEQLLDFFSQSDIFLSMSEHEGFSVPVVEAFLLGVPVIAFAGGAIPETVDEAGLVLDCKDPAVYAEAIHAVSSSQTLRDDLIRRGRARFDAEFRPEAVAERLKSYLREVIC